jgi:hypothetical protein
MKVNMDFSQNISRINQLIDYKVLNEQLSNATFNKTQLLSKDVRVEGPYDLRLDGNLYQWNNDLTLVKGQDLSAVYKIFNNSKDKIKADKVQIRWRETNQGWTSGPFTYQFTKNIISPNSYELLTIGLDKNFMETYTLPCIVDRGGECPKTSIKKTNFEGFISFKPADWKEDDLSKIGLPIMVTQTVIEKRLEPFSVNIPYNVKKIQKKSPLLIPEFISWVSTWDHHDWLTFVEVGAFLLASLTPAGWIAGVISLGAAGINTYMYFNEGDQYMGWVSLVFSVLPGFEVLKAVPAVSKYGVKGSLDVLWKAKKGIKMSAEEKIWMEQFQQQMKNNAGEISKLFGHYLVQKLILGLKRLPINKLIASLIILKRAGLYVGAGVVVLGGVVYSFDKIYAIISQKPEEVKQKSMLAPIYQMMTENDGQALKDSLQVEQGLKHLESNPEDTTKGLKVIEEVQLNKFQKTLDSIKLEQQKYIDSLKTKRIE